MTIHRSAIHPTTCYVLDKYGAMVFRGSYNECQAFCEGGK